MKYSGSLFLFLCAIITVLYAIGVLFFLTDHESQDKCEMTYMFEYPQFVRVSQEIDQKYHKYGLYAYGEGRITKKARSMHFDGIPVLFIPGNAGSYQQVRSLSSVALRKALNSGTTYHFDYFTVDLNGEFSALYGPVLYEQLEYVLNSIDRILDLYKNRRSPPQQVILIGHSVGGVVASKAIAELLKSKRNVVSVLITLAAPIKRGPIYFDRQISSFYKTSSFDKDNIVTISIGGGHSDFLVPSYLTQTEGNNTINLVATNIPKSWVESNHVQIVWCKQIVLALNRALFDSVDRQTFQISSDIKFIRGVFRHHLVHNSGTGHHLKPNFNKVTKINYKGEWIENLYKQYSIEHKKGIRQPQWYMVAFTALPTYEMLSVLAVNLEVTDWVFVCSAAFPNGASRVCVDGEHLTQYSEIVPTSRFKRRLITLNMHELRKNNTEYTHVVFRALPTSEPVTFHVDTYGSFERKTEISLPIFSLTKQTVLSQTPEKALVYDIILPGLQSILQVYQLFVEPIRCSSKQHHATGSLIVPWSNENIHSHFTEVLSKPFTIRLQNPKPQTIGDARVRLILEPTCTYKISVRLHIFGVFGQLARYYNPFLITNLAVVFLLGLQRQISVMGETGTIPIFFSAVRHGLNQTWIFSVAFLISNLCYSLKALPPSEFIIFPNERFNILVPLIMLMVSIVVMFILVAVYCVSLFAMESTVHKLTLKLLAKTVTLTIRFSDYFMKFLQKVPFIVAAVLVSLCFVTCGGLALCVGMVFYFLKLTQMSQDYVEEVSWFILKEIAKIYKKVFSRNTPDNNIMSTEESAAVEEETAVENLNILTQSSSDNKDSNGEQIGDGDQDKQNNEDITELNSKDSKDESDHEHNIGALTSRDHEATDKETPIQSMSETEIERQTEENYKMGLISNLSSTNNAIFFHSSMFFIWVFVTVLNIPAVLTWAHNFKYNKQLIPDESFLPGLVLTLSALPLWQLDLPRTDRKYTSQLRIIILCFTLVSLLYATISVYRLNYMLTILFALIVIQQCYAPKVRTEHEDPYTRTESRYDDTKMKMD